LPRFAQNNAAGKILITQATMATHHGVSPELAPFKTYLRESTISTAIKKNSAKPNVVRVSPENRN
jgi:hypothetical protein